jgi:hypothetical protein
MQQLQVHFAFHLIHQQKVQFFLGRNQCWFVRWHVTLCGLLVCLLILPVLAAIVWAFPSLQLGFKQSRRRGSAFFFFSVLPLSVVPLPMEELRCLTMVDF